MSKRIVLIQVHPDLAPHVNISGLQFSFFALLYFHGMSHDYYVAEMADDLLSVKGDLIKMDMGGYEPKMEGPWVFKRKGIYYFTMPENNRVLTYYTATSPKGPWKYQGIFMDEETNANNHHSIVEYQGHWIPLVANARCSL
jgi:hypothetical protein